MRLVGSNVGVVSAAMQFAVRKHKDQCRKEMEGSPYINHPIALAHVLCAAKIKEAAPFLPPRDRYFP